MSICCSCRRRRLKGGSRDSCNLLKYTRNGINLSVVPLRVTDGNRVQRWNIGPSTQCVRHDLLVCGQEIYEHGRCYESYVYEHAILTQEFVHALLFDFLLDELKSEIPIGAIVLRGIEAKDGRQQLFQQYLE